MSESPQARPRHARGGLGARIAWIAFLVLVAVLGFVLVYGSTVVDQVDAALGANSQDVGSLVGDTRPVRAGEDTQEPTDADAGNALNILLMGSDVREGDSAIDGADVEGMRNDTTIVLHISADRSRVEAVSIPRDAQVEIPECTYLDGSTIAGGTGDFNIAFSNGGAHGNAAEAAACTIKTVEQLSDVYIDHYVVIDFAGFVDMVDALGGVPMCITERIVSEKAHIDLEPGAQVLDGETALGYARLRTAEEGDVSGSDLQRITRQQQLLEQMATTVLSKNILTDVGELTRFARASAESVTMDTALASTSYLVGLAYSLRGLDPADVGFYTVPWAYTADYLNVEIQPEAEQMWDDIRNDRAISVDAEGDQSSEWDDGKKDSTTDTADEDGSGSEPAATSGAGDDSADETTTEDLLDVCR